MLTTILIILGTISYAIFGNVIVRIMDEFNLIDITTNKWRVPDEFITFILGMVFPIVWLYVFIREISTKIFIYFYD